MQKRQIVVTLSILLFGALIIGGVAFFTKKPTKSMDEASIVFLGEADQYHNNTIAMERSKTSTVSEIAPLNEQTRYEVALQTYNGHTLTFDQNCRASPVTFAIPKRTTIMLDNRSDQWLSISLGNRTTSIKPMDFTLVLFNKAGSILVHCNDVENVAIIDVTE